MTTTRKELVDLISDLEMTSHDYASRGTAGRLAARFLSDARGALADFDAHLKLTCKRCAAAYPAEACTTHLCRECRGAGWRFVSPEPKAPPMCGDLDDDVVVVAEPTDFSDGGAR